jgi:putative ABC transport system substrate-binding protein
MGEWMRLARLNRREFAALIAGAAFGRPLAARAQQAEGARRLGWLGVGKDHPLSAASIAAFRQGMSDMGWVEGRNLRIDYRWYEGDMGQFNNDAAELVALAPDVILASGGVSLGSLLRATRTVPIVFAHVNDPVARGFVASLARPGGNVTGFTHLEYQMTAKWLELLKRIAPHVARVGVLGGNFAGYDGRAQLEAIQSAAPSLGVEAIPLEVPVDITSAGEIESTIGRFVRGSNDGLIITENVATVFDYKLIVALAARHRLPAIYNQRYYVAEGGLVSYAPNDSRSWRAAAGYVDRILKGEKPADLPVQTPTKFELVINLKTAKALGLDISPALLSLADELIE